MGSPKRDANSDDFRRLLARLDANPESAWQEYLKLRLKLVAYFESFGHYVEAEDLADESLEAAEDPAIGQHQIGARRQGRQSRSRGRVGRVQEDEAGGTP